MRKYWNFVKLDYLSIKYELRSAMLLLFVFMSVIGYVSMGLAGAILSPVLFIPTFTSFTFSAGNNGLDAFYAALFIERKTVVIGRFLFATLLSAITVLVLFVTGILVALIMGDDVSFLGFASLLIGVFLVTTIVDFINLPFQFKWGFKKTRTFGMLLPILMFAPAVFVFYNSDIDMNNMDYLFNDIMNEIGAFMLYGNVSPWMIAVAVGAFAVWLVALIGSAALSIVFYRKRNF